MAAQLIDIESVVKSKLPQHYKKIPKWLFRFAAWLICQKEMNHVLITLDGKEGIEFADAMTQMLRVDYKIEGMENIPSEGRFIFTSNHPLGAFDGISCIKILGQRYPKFKLIANDMLMYVHPLRSIFLPVNTLGAQNRRNMAAINEAYHDPEIQLMTFPAGFCSRFMEGKIQDVAWKKSVITQAVESKRDIIPMYFEGRNSLFFYGLEWLRRMLGMKFNIGLILLPRQMMRHARGKTFGVRIGRPIPWQTFDDSRTPIQWAAWLREQTYLLKKN